MITVEHLTKRYGSQTAVKDLNFRVEQGEILGFLGPNGAGKSTTMNILTGYLSSSDGKVTINGYDMMEEPNKAKKCIGYLPELPPLYTSMTVNEYLNFAYDLKKINPDKGVKSKKQAKREHIEEVCGLVKISHVANRLIGNLSKGYRQRVGLAQALLGNPEVLILDEPTVGLDPKQIIEIRNLIRDLGEKHTIILSSHILSEIQAVCDRIIIINQGRIIANDTAENLSHHLSGNPAYTVRIVGAESRIKQALSSLKSIKKFTPLGSKEPGSVDFILQPETGTDIRKPLFEVLAKENLPLIGLKNNELTLEEIFLKLTTDSQQVARLERKTKEAKKKTSNVLNEVEFQMNSESEEDEQQ